MHDVSRGDHDGTRRGVDPQPAKLVDVDRDAFEGVPGQLDPNRAPEGGQPIPVGGRDVVEAVEAGREPGEEPVEQIGPVDGTTGFPVARRRGRGQVGRQPTPRDVATDADDDGAHRTAAGHVGFGEHAGELAVPDDQVVGPLELGGEPGDRRHRVEEGQRGGHRHQVHPLGLDGWSHERGHQQRRTGRGGPGAAPSTSAGLLMVGDDDEPGGGTGPGRVEREAVRRVDLVEATDAPTLARAGGLVTHRP